MILESDDSEMRTCGARDCPGYYPEVGQFLPGCGCVRPQPVGISEPDDGDLAEDNPDECYPALDSEVEKLVAGVLAVASLIDDSEGVAGLHLNGEMAPWDSLLAGGKYESWLAEFSEALEVALALRIKQE